MIRTFKSSWLFSFIPGILISVASPHAYALVGGVMDAPNYEFPQTALLNFVDENQKMISGCTGYVVAPRVVITAGHCLVGDEIQNVKWVDVVVNHRDGVMVRTMAFPKYTYVPDFVAQDQLTVTANGHHDIGFIFLTNDTKITLAGGYPAIGNAVIKNNFDVKALGRKDANNKLNFTLVANDTCNMEKSPIPTTFVGVSRISQAGDSGGPVWLKDKTKIVGHVSRSGKVRAGNVVLEVDFYERLDKSCAWIDKAINDNGGGGPGCNVMPFENEEEQMSSLFDTNLFAVQPPPPPPPPVPTFPCDLENDPMCQPVIENNNLVTYKKCVDGVTPDCVLTPTAIAVQELCAQKAPYPCNLDILPPKP